MWSRLLLLRADVHGVGEPDRVRVLQRRISVHRTGMNPALQAETHKPIDGLRAYAPYDLNRSCCTRGNDLNKQNICSQRADDPPCDLSHQLGS